MQLFTGTRLAHEAYIGATKVWQDTTERHDYTSGTSTYTVPEWATHISVMVLGGGGGGAGGQDGHNGDGGGAATWSYDTHPVIPGQPIQIQVGAGGAPGSANGYGSPGGTSAVRFADGYEVQSIGGRAGAGAQGRQDNGQSAPTGNYLGEVIPGGRGGVGENAGGPATGQPGSAPGGGGAGGRRGSFIFPGQSGGAGSVGGVRLLAHAWDPFGGGQPPAPEPEPEPKPEPEQPLGSYILNPDGSMEAYLNITGMYGNDYAVANPWVPFPAGSPWRSTKYGASGHLTHPEEVDTNTYNVGFDVGGSINAPYVQPFGLYISLRRRDEGKLYESRSWQIHAHLDPPSSY